MEAIATLDKKRKRDDAQVVRLKVGSNKLRNYLLFVDSDSVMLTDYSDSRKVYLVCDFEMFLALTGYKVVFSKPKRPTLVNRDGSPAADTLTIPDEIRKDIKGGW